MDEIHQSRNLSVSQTLDEILGVVDTRRVQLSPSSSSSMIEKNSINSPIRPPTRHGRESAASSNEENKDPLSIMADAQSSASKRSSIRQLHETTDDEFLNKLNEIRRRSLISIEQPSNGTSTIGPSTSTSRELPKRLPIHVEVEEAHASTPTTPPDRRQLSNLTFRIDDDQEKSVTPIVVKQMTRSKSAETKKHQNATAKEDRIMKSKFCQPPTGNDSHSKWLRKKMEEEQRQREKKLKEEEEKKLKEKERRENAAKLFARWKADRDELIRRELEKRRQREAARKQREQEEKNQKKVEAAKQFDAWRRERSKSVTDLKKRLDEQLEQKRKNEEAAKAEKQREAKLAFQSWLKKKQNEIQKTKKSGSEEDEDEATKQYRQLMAQEAYETWLEMKDQERDMMSHLVLVEAPPIPWIPPSNIIPRQFIASANGTRRLKRSQSAKNVRTRSRPTTTTSLRPFR